MPSASLAYSRMTKYFLGGCLLALFATGCNSSSAPNSTTTTTHPDATNHGALDHLTGMSGSVPTDNSPRAQAMRLHDAAMNSMDALASERQRLAGRLTKLGSSDPSAPRLQRAITQLQQSDKQMMDWMHNLHEPDSTSQPRAQVDAFWRQELPGLQQLDQRIKAALDSAKAIR
jgi:hypothetical protein